MTAWRKLDSSDRWMFIDLPVYEDETLIDAINRDAPLGAPMESWMDPQILDATLPVGKFFVSMTGIVQVHSWQELDK